MSSKIKTKIQIARGKPDEAKVESGGKGTEQYQLVALVPFKVAATGSFTPPPEQEAGVRPHSSPEFVNKKG